MKFFLRLAALLVILAGPAQAHVVSQIYGEWKEPADGSWEIEVLFEGGYAVRTIREDPAAPAPDRDWLMAQGEARWREMRIEAERYLRESLAIRSRDQAAGWRVEFPDFQKSPPDFPALLNNGAYLRMRVLPTTASKGPVQLTWSAGERPTFILKMASAEGGYLSLAPGDREKIAVDAKRDDAQEARPRGVFLTSFLQGYRHVVPQGWDHVLFVLGLFFYRRKWKALLNQSLAFTAAHTVTLGLAAAGIVKVSGNWVEPVIALSLVAVALENFRAGREPDGRLRMGIVFGFGLIHGLGFAGALSAWLKPDEEFLPSLLAANLGVEAAQAMLLGGAWLLTIGWHQTQIYRAVRAAGCVAIAVTGGYWALQRIGWIG